MSDMKCRNFTEIHGHLIGLIAKTAKRRLFTRSSILWFEEIGTLLNEVFCSSESVHFLMDKERKENIYQK